MTQNYDELLKRADARTEIITGATYEDKWSGVVFVATKTKDTLTSDLAAAIRALQDERDAAYDQEIEDVFSKLYAIQSRLVSAKDRQKITQIIAELALLKRPAP